MFVRVLGMLALSISGQWVFWAWVFWAWVFWAWVFWACVFWAWVLWAWVFWAWVFWAWVFWAWTSWAWVFWAWVFWAWIFWVWVFWGGTEHRSYTRNFAARKNLLSYFKTECRISRRRGRFLRNFDLLKHLILMFSEHFQPFLKLNCRNVYYQLENT